MDAKQSGDPEEFSIAQAQLMRSPRAAWIYWLAPEHRRILDDFPKLGQVAPPRQGLATTDNARFVRWWWEVEPTTPDAPHRATAQMWQAYVKAGRFRRWYEAPRHRVNWLDDGREIKRAIVQRYPYLNGDWQWVAKNSSFYGREGVTYSYLTSGRFSARRLERGAIFDVAGSSLFPDDPLTLLGVLNSGVAQQLLAAINPTVNFQVGDLAQLPVPERGTEELRALVTRAIEVQKRMDTFDETSPDFVVPMDWRVADAMSAENREELAKLEQSIEHLVHALYGLEPREHVAPAESLDRQDLARRWVSFALRRVLEISKVARVRPADDRLVRAVAGEILDKLDADCLRQIESRVGGLGDFLASDFFPWHAQLFQRRPVIWLLGSDDRARLVLHDHAEVQGWKRCIDDGVLINLAALIDHVPDRTMHKALSSVNEDLCAGRYDWSATWRLSRAWNGGCVPPRGRRPRECARRAEPLAGRR
jgi:hypothetical protein